MMKYTAFLLLVLLSLGCEDDDAPDIPMVSTPAAIESCKLARGTSNNVAIGIPKVEGLAPSEGVVNLTILFVDFDDVPATRTVEDVYSIINPITPDFFDETSYGRMQLKMEPHLEWLRLSQSSEFYGGAIFEGRPHLNFIQEAVDLADMEVDFSQADLVLVVANPAAEEIPFGPTFTSLDPNFSIQADGARISTGITSGFDLNFWGGIWLTHEMGHSLSLPDLYDYGGGDIHRHVGTFGQMGTTDAKAPGYFAFERWMLGWLDDSQIYCHDEGETVVDIEAIETAGGTKAVIVPLSGTKALVVESRRKIGFDRDMEKEGALVYVVDTRISSGRGAIKVKPGVSNGFLLEDAPMVAGDTYTFEGVTVEVVESKVGGDKIRVRVD